MSVIANSKQANPSITAVKGVLATKSSALATNGCKLEKQFLTAQNMASHYKRVINAKPSIDTNPPKSMLASQKARDRAKREMLKFQTANKNLERAKSADTFRNSMSVDQTTPSSSNRLTEVTPRTVKSARTQSGKADEPIKPRKLPDQAKLNQEMSNLMSNFTKHSLTRTQIYKPTRSTEEAPSKAAMTMKSTTNLRGSTAHSLNQSHAMSDTKAPRMAHPALKAMSANASSPSYDVLDKHQEKFKNPSKEFEPRIKSAIKAQSNLLKNDNCYQPPRRKTSKTNMEQSQLWKNQEDEEHIYEEIKDDVVEETNNAKSSEFKRSFEANTSKADQSVNLNNSTLGQQQQQQQDNLKRSAEKEEEIKYLQFIKEVTDDVISRGVTTNRVINNVFEYHIKRNRHNLSEKKMRDLVNTLKHDIGMPSELEEKVDISPHYHQSINRAIMLDKEKEKENWTDAGSYLVLKQFGWHETSQLNSARNMEHHLAFSTDHTNEERQGQRASDAYAFETYESQIMRNIESIRKTSRSSNEENAQEEEVVGQRVDERHEEMEKRRNSFQSNNMLNSQSNSRLSNQTTTATAFSEQLRNMNDETVNNNQAQTSNANNYDEFDNDDDDDDIFTGNSYTNNKQKATFLTQEKQPEEEEMNLATTSKVTFNNLVQQTVKKSEYADDILFNDDYGQSDDEDNKQAEHFDELLQKKKASIQRKQHTEKAESPRPAPRKSFMNAASNLASKREESDEDESDGIEF